MSKRCLVTGANGFIGRHLAAHLIETGHEVVGWERPGLTAGASPLVTWIEVDILDAASLQDAVRQSRPDRVYHLAALIRSNSVEELFRTNVLGTQNLLDALLAARHPPRSILVATSAAEYGLVPEADLPVKESQSLCPLSPYGLSKAAQFLLAQQYQLQHGLPIVQTRSFNMSGPGEPPSLVGGSFARQVAEIEAGMKEPSLTVGNLSTERDFLDVRDAVRALAAVCENGQPGSVYNVCSGQPRAIDSLLRALLAMSTRPIHTVPDFGRFSSSDVPKIYGDPGRLHEATGWKPLIPFDDTLRDLLEYWRSAYRTPGSPPH